MWGIMTISVEGILKRLLRSFDARFGVLSLTEYFLCKEISDKLRRTPKTPNVQMPVCSLKHTTSRLTSCRVRVGNLRTRI